MTNTEHLIEFDLIIERIDPKSATGMIFTLNVMLQNLTRSGKIARLAAYAGGR